MSRREIIINEAYKLFAKYGYSGTTLEKIAKRSGITKAAIYIYFKTKKDLFITVLEEKLKEFAESLKRIEKYSDKEPDEKLQLVVREFVSVAKKQKGLFAYFEKNDYPLPPEVKREMSQKILPFFDSIEMLLSGIIDAGIKSGIFREDLQPRMAARALLGMIRGVLKPSPKTSVASKTIIEIFFFGMKRRCSSS